MYAISLNHNKWLNCLLDFARFQGHLKLFKPEQTRNHEYILKRKIYPEWDGCSWLFIGLFARNACDYQSLFYYSWIKPKNNICWSSKQTDIKDHCNGHSHKTFHTIRIGSQFACVCSGQLISNTQFFFPSSVIGNLIVYFILKWWKSRKK